MKLPSDDECHSLLAEFHTPANVIRHSQQVDRVACFIAKKLEEKGVSINVDLVHKAALLHDIVRTIDFGDMSASDAPANDIIVWKKARERFSGLRHAEAGFVLFKDRYPELALVIRKHVYKAIDSLDDSKRPLTWEEKVLNYADKRVAHERIVTLKERFFEGHRRWNNERPEHKEDEKETEKIDREHYELEKEIFTVLGLEPEKLDFYLKEENTDG